MKMLLKLQANVIYVRNKLELCRQDKVLETRYSSERAALKRTPQSDRNPTDLYVRFINDVMERFLLKKMTKKTKDASSSSRTSLNNDSEDESVVAASGGEHENSSSLSSSIPIELPDSMDEFKRKYRVLNSLQQRDALFRPRMSYFKQPTTDYEISCNTVQAAIHVNLQTQLKVYI